MGELFIPWRSSKKDSFASLNQGKRLSWNHQVILLMLQKSGKLTSSYGKHPIISRFLYIQPVVVWDFFHQPPPNCHFYHPTTWKQSSGASNFLKPLERMHHPAGLCVNWFKETNRPIRPYDFLDTRNPNLSYKIPPIFWIHIETQWTQNKPLSSSIIASRNS